MSDTDIVYLQQCQLQVHPQSTRMKGHVDCFSFEIQFSHPIVLVITQGVVHKFSRYYINIILINANLQSHWTLSKSEVSPRIWICVTRPSHVHVCRVWVRDYR